MRSHFITDADDLRAHEPLWRQCESAGAVPNVFASFDWIAAYWNVFGAGRRLLTLVQTHGAATAIAPLMVSRAAGRSLRRLELIGAGIHDYSDFILPPDDNRAAARLWNGVLKTRRRWDSLRFQQLREDSPALLYAPAMRATRAPGETCPSLHLPPTWDDYQQMLGKNMRYDLKRYAKKMRADFDGVQFRLVRTPAELESAWDALVALHSARWRKRGLPGVLATPKRRQFQIELARALLERDRLRLFVLELDGAPAAVLLNYVFGRRYFFYIGGFDPNRERYRPGTILFGHAIRHAIEEGVTEFDFLRGKEEYKYRLGARDRAYQSLVITQDSLRSRVAAAHARVGERIVAHARRFAESRYRRPATSS